MASCGCPAVGTSQSPRSRKSRWGIRITHRRGTRYAAQAARTHCPSFASRHPHKRASRPHLQRGKLRHRRTSQAKGQKQDLLSAHRMPFLYQAPPPPNGWGRSFSPTPETGETEAREGRVCQAGRAGGCAAMGSAPPSPRTPVKEGPTVPAPGHSARTTQARPTERWARRTCLPSLPVPRPTAPSGLTQELPQ